ncbi:MAG: RNA polymerase factor sigma-32 [Candidatus Magasanikbacteria bacterium]|nr:RNA polymerase factor sigma-32 [Candidatus Magasanikbacteria bacterium]
MRQPRESSSVWGAYVREVSQYPLLNSSEEERRLAVQARAGNQPARNRLVTSNLRLVIKIAGQYRGYGFPWEDLVSEGNLGLLRAVEKFDPNHGTQLSTYAAWWIRAFILRFIIRNFRLVKLGTTHEQRRLFFHISRARRQLEKDGLLADARGIAEWLDMPLSVVEEMAERMGHPEISLATPVDTKRTLSDVLPSEAASPEELLLAAEENAFAARQLQIGLRALNPREREIVRRRHLVEEPATLKTLGSQQEVTRERIRQVEQRALKKLRAHFRRLEK